jgi:tripartite-type tricarboxylate transporter receptor subunit TctC
MRKLISHAILVFIAVAAEAVQSQGPQYPTKPVRIVAPFAPGGGTDFIARLIAQRLSGRLGQQFIVENKPGAGGNLGAELAVKSAPDGYTLLLISGSYTVNPSLYKLSFDPVNDISAIIQLSQGPFVIAVHPSLPARTLKELIDAAKQEPGKLSYGSSGSGSITHLAAELFLDMAGAKIVHVPYKGTGPALNDTIAGNVQVIFGSVSTTLQFIKSGRLRGLAVTTAKRIPAAPELPTVAEAGIPGYEVVLWHGLIGPGGIPRTVLDRLNREANLALQAKDMETLLATDGVAPAGGSPEQFLAVIRGDIERWRKVVQQANVKVE